MILRQCIMKFHDIPGRRAPELAGHRVANSPTATPCHQRSPPTSASMSARLFIAVKWRHISSSSCRSNCNMASSSKQYPQYERLFDGGHAASRVLAEVRRRCRRLENQAIRPTATRRHCRSSSAASMVSTGPAARYQKYVHHQLSYREAVRPDRGGDAPAGAVAVARKLVTAEIASARQAGTHVSSHTVARWPPTPRRKCAGVIFY